MSEKRNAIIYGFGTDLENPFSCIWILANIGFWTSRTHVYFNFERSIDHFFLLRLKLKKKAENSGFDNGHVFQCFAEGSLGGWFS
jgi:hypothetical protein